MSEAREPGRPERSASSHLAVGSAAQLDVAPLFTPFALDGLTLPNRFVLPGMQRGLCRDGAPTARMTEYYRRRIAGGCGMIVSESVAVDHPTSTQNERFAWMTERTCAAWARCIAAVKEEGGSILLQMWHEGARRAEGGSGPYASFPTISPSGLVDGGHRQGRAATPEELEELKAAFVASALMAKHAGAAGVEIHAAHGYLLDQFLWPATNRRDDIYGGIDIRDRARLPAEIIAAVRTACGPDFIVGLRFSQWKETDYSARVVESAEQLGAMLRLFENAGLSIIHASTRKFWVPEWQGSDLSLAGWCKRLSRLPVIAVGSVGIAADIEEPAMQIRHGVGELLRRFDAREFDLISVGRSQISDPNWVNKVRSSDFGHIRPYQPGDTARGDEELAELAGGYPR